MVTDTIGDLIIRIKNANKAGKETAVVYTSKLKLSVLEALVRAGFITSVTKIKGGKFLEITLKYDEEKNPRVANVARISKPSRRMYNKATELKTFKNGFGAVILSTPKGILSNKEAFKQKIGGEALFKIW